MEQNFNYGILATGHGVRAAITNSQVIGSRFRTNPAAGNAPTDPVSEPGTGIAFEDGARGVIADSVSIRNFGAGLTKRGAAVKHKALLQFDNGDRDGKGKGKGKGKGRDRDEEEEGEDQ